LTLLLSNFFVQEGFAAFFRFFVNPFFLFREKKWLFTELSGKEKRRNSKKSVEDFYLV